MPTLSTRNLSREHKVHTILLHDHGVGGKVARNLEAVAQTFSPRSNRHERSKPPSPEALAAETELEALPDDQLESRYQAVLTEKARAAAEQLMKEGLAAAEQRARADAAAPFNSPKAKPDYSHWAKCGYWTLEEAVLLAFDREPTIATPATLQAYKHISEFVRVYERTLDMANRNVDWGQLTKPVRPGEFIAWAKRYDIPVPPELEAEVEKYGHFVGDWKTLFDNAKVVLAKAQADGLKASELATQLQAEVNKLSAMLAASIQKTAKRTDSREIDSLRKLVIAMAVAGYKYNPADSRNAAISDIVGDLERLGLALDADTVRSHLKKAAELLPPNATDGLVKPNR